MLFDRFWDPKNGRQIGHLLGVFDHFGGVFLGPFVGFFGGGFARRGQFFKYNESLSMIIGVLLVSSKSLVS